MLLIPIIVNSALEVIQWHNHKKMFRYIHQLSK